MAFGDRKNGYKVKDIKGVSRLVCDLKPNRCDSEIYMNDKIDVTNFVKLINDLKKDHPHLTYYQGIVTLIAKTIYSRPKMNYYVQDRTIFEHKNVSIGQVVKEEFTEGSREVLLVYKVKKDDNLLTVSDGLYEKIHNIRSKKGVDIDGPVNFFGNLPNILRVPAMGLIKFLDRKDLLPNSFSEGNLYYSSAILSDIGVFKVGAIHHNLTNLGTSSMLITLGEIKKEGNKYYMEFGATLDERIADGFYFCKALKLIEYLFANPKLLLEPAGDHVTIPKKNNI